MKTKEELLELENTLSINKTLLTALENQIEKSKEDVLLLQKEMSKSISEIKRNKFSAFEKEKVILVEYPDHYRIVVVGSVLTTNDFGNDIKPIDEQLLIVRAKYHISIAKHNIDWRYNKNGFKMNLFANHRIAVLTEGEVNQYNGLYEKEDLKSVRKLIVNILKTKGKDL